MCRPKKNLHCVTGITHIFFFFCNRISDWPVVQQVEQVDRPVKCWVHLFPALQQRTQVYATTVCECVCFLQMELKSLCFQLSYIPGPGQFLNIKIIMGYLSDQCNDKNASNVADGQMMVREN